MDFVDFEYQVSELNRGARLMNTEAEEANKLSGAEAVSKAGLALVDAGGIALLRKAHAAVDPEFQRTVELQWYGLTDTAGFQWLP